MEKFEGNATGVGSEIVFDELIQKIEEIDSMSFQLESMLADMCSISKGETSEGNPPIEEEISEETYRGVMMSVILKFLNNSTKDELKLVKGVKELRAGMIIESRERKPFENEDDIMEELEFSKKQIKGFLENVAAAILEMET